MSGQCYITALEVGEQLIDLARKVSVLHRDLGMEVIVETDESDKVVLKFFCLHPDGERIEVGTYPIPGTVVRRVWNERARGDA